MLVAHVVGMGISGLSVTMRAGLLHHYGEVLAAADAVNAEAVGWGLELANPMRDHWETVSEFVDAYCRETSPAGVLIVNSDPFVGGSVGTGIPFTDPVRARNVLNLQVAGEVASPASERFWSVISEVKRDAGGPLEGLFASVHLASAFPFGLAASREPASLSKYLPSMPRYREACRAHLTGLLGLLRPQVVLCVGRTAFEAVAAIAENRHALAARLAETGWERLVLSREYAEGVHGFPRGEFPGFRSYLVPIGDLEGPASAPLAAHAHDTLHRLVSDAWT